MAQKEGKIEHEEVRRIWRGQAAETAPPEVQLEEGLVNWAQSLCVSSMRLAAAGVLNSLGSLNKVADVLYWAGYQVPPRVLP